MQEIVTEKIITNTRAKEILKKRDKEIELGYDQKNSLDYLKKYDQLTKTKAKKMMEELSEKIPKLRNRQIISIVNVLPQDLDDLRVVMEKNYTSLDEDEKKLILKTVKDNM